MSDGMYFGTKGNMKWVPAPRIGVSRTPVKYGSTTQYISGGVLNNTSAVGAMKYEMDWALKSEEALRHVRHCASGLYSTVASADENPLVYFLDPFAMNANVLPSYWSAPSLAHRGAPRIGGDGGDPSALGLYDTGTVAANYPNPAIEILGGGSNLWIPVPSGYTFHFGVQGVTVGGAQDVFVYMTRDGFAGVSMPFESPSSNQALTYSFDVTGADSGVTISVGGRSTFSAVHNYIAGMVARIVPTGQDANIYSGFVLGRGHSGCEFTSDGFEEGGYSAALDLEQFSATLVETGAWK